MFFNIQYLYYFYEYDMIRVKEILLKQMGQFGNIYGHNGKIGL